MTPNVTEELLAKAKGRDRAAVGLILEKMKGAVKKVALTFSKAYPSLDMDDLIQEGYLAVMKAIRNWDKTRGVAAFTSYAYRAIINTARHAIDRRVRQDEGEVQVNMEQLDKSPARVEAEGLLEQEAFKDLTPEEASVMAARIEPVMEGGGPRDWKEVGKIVGMSHERCREIWDRIIKKLRTAHEGKL